MDCGGACTGLLRGLDTGAGLLRTLGAGAWRCGALYDGAGA